MNKTLLYMILFVVISVFLILSCNVVRLLCYFSHQNQYSIEEEEKKTEEQTLRNEPCDDHDLI